MTASSHQILSDYETSSASSTCLLYSKRTELVESPTETFCNRTDTAETFNVISNKIRDRSTSRPRPATPIAVCVTTEPLARWPHYDASSTPGTLHHANTMPQAIRTESFASSETVVSRNSASTDEQNHHDPNDRGGFKRMSYGRHSGDWLFGGFSVKRTVKKAVGKKEKEKEKKKKKKKKKKKSCLR